MHAPAFANTSTALVPVPAVTGNDKLWAIVCHLSEFIGAPFLIPLIIYLVMKNESAFVRSHAREALNFHLSLLLYSVLCVPLLFIGVGFLLLAGLWLLAFVFAIIAAVRAGGGGSYRYPLTIRFVG